MIATPARPASPTGARPAPSPLETLREPTDAVVARTELAMPPAITVEMAKGFTLYMVKAVMSGRTDEIIDLAQGNLWR